MKNLKKMSRDSLKSIKGGGYILCPMPSGTPAICEGTVCPSNPCTAIPYCRVSIDDCGTPVIW